MKTIQLTVANRSEYGAYLSPELVEHLDRLYFRGLVLLDDEEKFDGAIFWEMLNVESDSPDKEIHIVYFLAGSEDGARLLISDFEKEVDKTAFLRITGEIDFSEKIDPGIVFAEYGYRIRKQESVMLMVTLRDFAGVKALMNKKIPRDIVLLNEVDEHSYKKGLLQTILYSRRKLVDDAYSLPREWFDERLSCCFYTGEPPSGILLVHVTPKGRLHPEMLSAYGDDVRSKLLLMIICGVKQAVKHYPPETEVIITRRDEMIWKLMQHFFPEQHGRMILYIEKGR